jgi:putative transcriptional regulator
MSDVQYLTGRLLLAMPGMGDPRFDHAVIAMCVHDENGALGIGLGKLHPGLRFHQLLDNVGLDPGKAPDAPVHNGGPCETQRGFILHSPEWELDDTIVVEGRFGLSASLEALKAITLGRGPERWVFALGYAGWGAGQLDNEMKAHGWFAAEGRDKIVFDTPAAVRWTAAWKAEGVDPSLLANTTGRA